MLQLLLNSMFSAFPGIWTESKKDDVSAPIPEVQEKSECAPVGKVKQNPLEMFACILSGSISGHDSE